MARLDQRRTSIWETGFSLCAFACAVWSRNLISSSWKLRGIWRYRKNLNVSLINNYSTWLVSGTRTNFQVFTRKIYEVCLYARMKRLKIYWGRKRKARHSSHFLFYFDISIENGRLKVFKIAKIRNGGHGLVTYIFP